jgi:hypothetical protein
MTGEDISDRLLTQREYARYRRYSVRTVERERAVGTGCPYVRIGARILYRLADVDRFVDAHRIGGSDLPKRGLAASSGPPVDTRASSKVMR